MGRLTRRKEDVPGYWEYDCSSREVIEKLAEYEDLEEQGKLLRLAEPVINDYTLIIRNGKAHYLVREIDLEKDIIEIECAIKSQIACDNMFTVSVLQKCLKMYDELKSYRDLEEQGKLLKLPYKLGDTVYTLNIGFADNIVINEYRIEEVSTHRIWVDSMYYDHSDIGKTVFLTEAEAEAALKEMEK